MANNSDTPYNWHPAVHSVHFGETLYFVMIRLREPLHTPVATQVKDLLETAGIQYACSYPLFGWWDALVRVWLTPASYNRFARVLENSVNHNVANFRGFTTTNIRYLWSESTKDLLAPTKKLLTTIAGHRGDIEFTVQSPDRTDTKEWASLQKAGLVILRPKTPKGGVKFYTSLERTSEDVLLEKREIEAILNAMKSTVLGTSNVPMTERSTLYCGAGTLANYLVRCVADSYDDVLALAESFDKHLRETHLRPMTLLVANPGASYESDNVNDTLHLTPDDSNLAEMLGLESPKILANLPAKQRHELHQLSMTACERSNDDDLARDMLLRMLRATASNDRTEFQASLSFLLDFEPIFKDAMTRELAGIFGNNWLPTIKAYCESNSQWRKHAEEMEMEFDKWTLGNFIFTARAAGEMEPKFIGWLERRWGENWNTEVDTLVELRNDLAHGRVHNLEPLDTYDEPLTSFLLRAMNAALFWRLCQRDSQDQDTRSQDDTQDQRDTQDP